MVVDQDQNLETLSKESSEILTLDQLVEHPLETSSEKEATSREEFTRAILEFSSCLLVARLLAGRVSWAISPAFILVRHLSKSRRKELLKLAQPIMDKTQNGYDWLMAKDLKNIDFREFDVD